MIEWYFWCVLGYVEWQVVVYQFVYQYGEFFVVQGQYDGVGDYWLVVFLEVFEVFQKIVEQWVVGVGFVEVLLWFDLGWGYCQGFVYVQEVCDIRVVVECLVLVFMFVDIKFVYQFFCYFIGIWYYYVGIY